MNYNIPKEVQFIINCFQNHGFKGHIVGGCVRDIILNRLPNDWDITTNAYPEDITSIFKHTVPTGIKHGTITIILDNKQFEATTYRIDGEYTDNRHPDSVVFTDSLEEDLSRRDFTINAMAYNDTCGLIDPFGGVKDLKNKNIRCVGNAHNRFNEDALRMIRAVRFANQLNFEIFPETFQAIAANCPLIQKISVERIREEFCKILLCDKPSYGILLLKNSGLLHYILPEIITCIGFKQLNPHHDKDVFEHTLSVLDNSPKNLVVRLAALLHDIGKPDCFTVDAKGIGHFYGHHEISAEKGELILRRFKFDNNTIKRVSLIVREHMTSHISLKDSSIKKIINRVGVDNLPDLFELQLADIKGSACPQSFDEVEYLKKETQRILAENHPLTVKDIAVNGSDLIKLGFKPGKKIGEILQYLLEQVLNEPDLNIKEKLIEIVQSKFSIL